MATLKGWLQGILGRNPNQNDGKFQWEDLLNASALINAIKGKPTANNGLPIPEEQEQAFEERETIETPFNNIIDKIFKPKEETNPSIQQNVIQDKTMENIETPINNDIYSFMKEQQAKQWEREDEIRAETQKREDTAYQRAVADMQAAGINPNLMNVNAAASGGGITSATGLEYNTYKGNLDETLTLLEQEIENKFKEDENEKDRFNSLISSLIMGLLFRK